MRNIFDELLEELQRRQQEQDARREGRELPRPLRQRRRGGRGGGDDGAGDGGGGGDGGRGRGPGGPDDGADRGPFSELRRYRRPVLFGVAAVAILVLLGVVGGLASFLTDLMWYDSLGLRQVMVTRVLAQLGWFFVGLLLFLVPALVSIVAARRLAPRVPVRRIGTWEVPDVSGTAMVVIVVVAVLFALGFGTAWGSRWERILLFANGGSFGTSDPNFGQDIGFYVFQLPFLRFVQGWSVAALLVVLLLTLAVYAAGSMRWQFQLTAPVRAHLSILGALFLVAIAVGYQLDVYELSYSERGIGGAMHAVSYTDLNAQRPAFTILTFVALAAAVLLVANIWFRTLWLLTLAVGAWFVLSIVVGGLYPAAVQRFQVEPNELALEGPFIERHIAATREAFGLDEIDDREFTGQAPLTRELFTEERETLANARLWDYRPLLLTFGQQQILRQYYAFLDVDIDRYQIDGEQRQVMLSPREMRVENLSQTAPSWTTERLIYTHGYGITAVPVNAVTPGGQPEYLVSGIDPDPELPLGEPRIYFGEGTNAYVVVGTQTNEFDYPLEDREVVTTWQGETGVGIGNPLVKLLFAIRFGDMNLLISDQPTDESQVLFRRQITERVNEIAPFLELDPDPYIVSAAGRLTWVMDAYTMTDRYPNAQPLDDVYPGINYLRNSVKVTVDAYDGRVRFYIADPDDPLIRAYQRIFPGIFEPLDAMPAELREHLRYPEWLFRAQNESYLVYHVTPDERGASIFYNREDVWSIPMANAGVDGGQPGMEPYYVIMRIPGEEEAEFVLIQPLAAARRPNMVAWVAARNDRERYGEVISFRFPADTSTLGPEQVQARIDQDPIVSAQFTLWNQAGSEVVRGNLLVIPMGDSILYIEPIYLQSTQSRFPEFRRVILASQTRIAFAPTLEEGLSQLLGETTVPPPDAGEEPGDGEEPTPDDVTQLVTRIDQLFTEAEQALAQGDLATYESRLEEAQRLVDRLAELLGAPAPGTSPSPAPSP